ncbi:MAG: radical SAM protein [Deltaproteobacteria bacterium]|nr:MAG: radical SAM protein [Deltaproteobacteria bacterium]
MAKQHIAPRALVADTNGQVYDHPHLLMVCRRGNQITLPRPDELIPLPPASDLYLLPGRDALGFDPETGSIERLDEGNAVAGFVCPSYTLSATTAYHANDHAPVLPLFAYGAIGYAQGTLWVTAKQVDTDKRQVFSNIPCKKIEAGARKLMKTFPDNRLVTHLAKCALTYGCPAAKNFALGRFEAPLPTSQACNARCVGCISLQPQDAGFPSSQNRITFRPTVQEICQVMLHHNAREKRAVYSFGQGCEGEPLTEAKLIQQSIARFRAKGGKGTVNINTNGSLPHTIEGLAHAGLSSIRVSLNSVRTDLYNAYYRPASFTFADVTTTICQAKAHGLYVSLNYLFFPGINDTEAELDALLGFLEQTRPDFIQMRNLSLDPDIYLARLPNQVEPSPSMGLTNLMKRIKKNCPWITFGYFNPYVGG